MFDKFLDNLFEILCLILLLCGLGLVILYIFFNGSSTGLGKGIAFIIESIFFYICIRKGKL